MVSQREGKVGGQSANRLDWALEVAGGLELQLVGHWMDLETIEPGYKLVGRSLGPVLWMHHEEHVRETSAKVCAIRVVVPGGLGCVHVHALGAVQLHHGLAWDVRKANGQHRLVLTVYTRTVTKVSLLVLFQHLCDASVGEDVAGVDQSIKHLSCLFNQVTLVGVVFQLFIRFQVQDHV